MPYEIIFLITSCCVILSVFLALQLYKIVAKWLVDRTIDYTYDNYDEHVDDVQEVDDVSDDIDIELIDYKKHIKKATRSIYIGLVLSFIIQARLLPVVFFFLMPVALSFYYYSKLKYAFVGKIKPVIVSIALGILPSILFSIFLLFVALILMIFLDLIF